MTNEEAIKNITAFAYYLDEPIPEDVAKAFDMAIKALKNETPHGEWIEGYCNKCGVSSLCDGWGRDVESRFCPNCGAAMREANNDPN